jgi:hypothetical protein
LSWPLSPRRMRLTAMPIIWIGWIVGTTVDNSKKLLTDSDSDDKILADR